ncbi:MAG: ABC transporter ATP-binding protein [Turneriella sp.]|nr:ABC transporter ATP-binding protein [Turneriella sp.]
MIRILDVYANYTEPGGKIVPALSGISLDINKADYVAVVGPSGSGKSTLVAAIAGLLPIAQGEIYVDKYRIRRTRRARRAKIRGSYFGIIFQSSEMLARFTVEENLRFAYVAANGSVDARYQRKLEYLCQKLGLTEFLRSTPTKLSGGQLRKAAIARALIKDPPFILADEPSGDLDPAAVVQVKKLLREENAQGKGILLVTHDNKLASDAKSVFELRQGKISAYLK